MTLSRGALGAAVLASLLAAADLAAAAGPSPFGLWARGDGKTRVRVERCGAQICAVNTWVRAGTRGERAGDRLVMNVKAVDAGRWSGTAFDIRRNRTYRLTVTVRDRSMTTHGCVLAGVVCRNMGWTRLTGE